MRLSAYLAQKHNCSRRFIKALIQRGSVSLNGVVVKRDGEAESCGSYSVDFILPVATYDIKNYFVKEVSNFLFLYKPPFMHTQRNTPEDLLCLDDVVAGSYPAYSLVTRLDYGADGITAAVKDGAGADIKGESKRYLAWVHGFFPEQDACRWIIDAAKRKRVGVIRSDSGGLMEFRRLGVSGGLSLIEVRLEKASRHQVRAVCASKGYPIAGDILYGAPGGLDNGRIFLHCAEMSFSSITCKSPYADDFLVLY